MYRSVIALMLVSGLGCSDSGTGPEELTGCTGAVTVAVTAGTTPTFTWTPRCTITFLIVEPADSGTDLWSIITEGSNGIGPGVQYGVAPQGAVELDAPAALVQGTAYKVVLWRHTGPGPNDAAISAVHTFTP